MKILAVEDDAKTAAYLHKGAAHYALEVPAGGSRTIRLRLAAAPVDDAFHSFDGIFASRIADADEFYQRITPHSLGEDERCGEQ